MSGALDERSPSAVQQSHCAASAGAAAAAVEIARSSSIYPVETFESRMPVNPRIRAESRVTTMLCHFDAVHPERRASRSGQAGANVRWLRSSGVITVPLEDSLRAPLLTGNLQNTVRALLLRGERDIVLDLAGVTRIDAAGVGELIRAYNMTTAADGSLRILHATQWVREVLERLHVFELLSGGHTGSAKRPMNLPVSIESSR